MMKNKTYILLLTLLFVAASCAKESSHTPGSDGLPLPQNSIAIKLTGTGDQPLVTYAQKTKAAEKGSAAENLIKELVVLVFPYTSGGTGVLETLQRIPLDPLPADQTKWATDSTLFVGGMKNLTAAKNLYVVANGTKDNLPLDITKLIVGTTTEAELKAKVARVAGSIPEPTEATPLLMSGSVHNYNFVTNKLTAQVGLSRAVAKIRLNISIDDAFKSAYPDITDWGVTRVVDGVTTGGVHTRAVNLADRTYIIGRSPSISPIDRVLIHPKFGAPSVPQTAPHTWKYHTYMLENPARGKTQATIDQTTYIIIHLPYTRSGVVQNNNYYKIYIQNPANTTDPYLVERNYIYDIKVVIVGFGMSQELADPDAAKATITVEPWGVVAWTTKLEDAKVESPAPIIIPPWDPMYDGGSSLGDSSGDQNTESGDGSTKPWDPNGNNNGSIGDTDNTGNTGSAGGATLPWVPNGDGGGSIGGEEKPKPEEPNKDAGATKPWDPNGGGVQL